MPKYKDFSEVVIGDLATDYGGYKYPVVGKGSLKEMFNQFGSRCSLGLSDYLDEEAICTENDEAIAVQAEPQWDGDVIIYLYSDMGAVVEK